MFYDREAYHPDDRRNHVLIVVVWELTLSCTLKCQHCGSRAGRRRTNELTTAECLDLVEQFARLGVREVGLIGGESFLRPDWLEVVHAISSLGMRCALQTGGWGLTQRHMEAAANRGVSQVGVSVDGLAALHDRVRGVRGSFERAFDVLKWARSAGLSTTVNTTLFNESLSDLPGLLEAISEAGVTHWQFGISAAMGNAVDNDDLLLQPYQLSELMPLLARLYAIALEKGVLLTLSNTVGYFGPYEATLRGHGDERVHYGGCQAGEIVIGLESDGTVKGCPSLPTASYAGGNIRDLKLKDLWNNNSQIHFTRSFSSDQLWGFCRRCYYADVCRGGCTWIAHSLFGKPGNNPYCHHRVLEFQKYGMRERVIKKRDAPKTPFSTGEFDLIREPIPGQGNSYSPSLIADNDSRPLTMPSQRGRGGYGGDMRPDDGCISPVLDLCHSCNRHIRSDEESCVHCGGNVQHALRSYMDEKQVREDLIRRLSTRVRKRVPAR